MGDLVIKPEAGGSIKLQNNAGTNALVSDNSGNITLAGNTTLSGSANNLGTVTAGSIAGGSITSATTFPAGHVIKTYSQVRDTHSGHDIDEAWTKIDFGGNFDISGVTATQGNKLVMQFGNLCYYTTGDLTYQAGVGVSTDGTTASDVLAYSGWYLGASITTAFLPSQFSWVYTVPANFTNKTLSVITRHQTGFPAVTSKFQAFQEANPPHHKPNVTFLVQEIQV